MIREMPKIPAATCYLDRDELTMKNAACAMPNCCATEIERQGPDSVLAFIMEPVGGASTGALVAPDSWYHEVQNICREYGVLLIADEVMTGAGRTGPLPRHRALGAADRTSSPWQKALLQAMRRWARWPQTQRSSTAVMEHWWIRARLHLRRQPTRLCRRSRRTRGGVAAKADRQCGRARGARLKSLLSGLMDRYPFIGDVRGKGLLLAFELVSDRGTMEPLPAELNAHVEARGGGVSNAA